MSKWKEFDITLQYTKRVTAEDFDEAEKEAINQHDGDCVESAKVIESWQIHSLRPTKTEETE